MAVAATLAGASLTLVYPSVTESEPGRPRGEAAVERQLAVEHCNEPVALMILIDLHIAGDDRAVLALGSELDAACHVSPNILAMTYRGACGAGDGPAAFAFAARLAALPPAGAPSWRGIACPPIDAR